MITAKEYRKTSELRNWDKNPRAIKKDRFEELKARITRRGQYKPLVITDDGEVLGGNMRLRAFNDLGIDDAWVSVVHPESEADKIAIALEDNEELGYYEDQAVAELIAQYKDEIDLTKYQIHLDRPKTLAEILQEFSPDEIVEDEAPEVSDEEPESKVGEVYQLGRHRLMCGDSTKIEDVEKLMDGKRADMVFTDPPYGISFESDSGASIQNDDLDIDGMLLFNQKWQKTAFDVSNNDVFMMAWQSPRLFHLMDMFGDWSFFRMYSMYKSNRISYPHGAWINKTEPCLIFAKGKPKASKENYIDDCYVYTHDKESHEDSNVGHPTPKPVKMITENLRAGCKKGSIVLDLFLGSGSTIIACEQTNRTCYGMELDPKYSDVIRKRYWKFTHDNDEEGWIEGTKETGL